jgi:predicted nucleotidyltransferase component of viral defense system
MCRSLVRPDRRFYFFRWEQPPVLRTYPEFEDIAEDSPISVYSLNEIATEKVVALQDRPRNEPRDLYDLCFLTSHAGVEIGHLIGAITENPLSEKRYYWHRSPLPRKRSSSDGTVERASRASDGSIARIR